MKLEVSISIEANPEKVWGVITDLEGAKERISGIEELEILHKPRDEFLGTKWKETRVFGGKSSTETMWISEVDEGKRYVALAESHGCHYRSEFSLESLRGGTRLNFCFSGKPLNFLAKVMSFLLGPLFRGSLKKVMEKDLHDIKKSVEGKSS